MVICYSTSRKLIWLQISCSLQNKVLHNNLLINTPFSGNMGKSHNPWWEKNETHKVKLHCLVRCERCQPSNPRSISYTRLQREYWAKSCWINVHDRKDLKVLWKKNVRAHYPSPFEQDLQKPKPMLFFFILTGSVTTFRWQLWGQEVEKLPSLPLSQNSAGTGSASPPTGHSSAEMSECGLLCVHPLSQLQIRFPSNECNVFISWNWPTEDNSVWQKTHWQLRWQVQLMAYKFFLALSTQMDKDTTITIATFIETTTVEVGQLWPKNLLKIHWRSTWRMWIYD